MDTTSDLKIALCTRLLPVDSILRVDVESQPYVTSKLNTLMYDRITGMTRSEQGTHVTDFVVTRRRVTSRTYAGLLHRTRFHNAYLLPVRSIFYLCFTVQPFIT